MWAYKHIQTILTETRYTDGDIYPSSNLNLICFKCPVWSVVDSLFNDIFPTENAENEPTNEQTNQPINQPKQIQSHMEKPTFDEQIEKGNRHKYTRIENGNKDTLNVNISSEVFEEKRVCRTKR